MSSIDFSVNYMGLNLRNPFIVSSSGLTSTLEGILSCEENGAGAVVLKSIFEEQISLQAANTMGFDDFPEAADYLNSYTKHNALGEYLSLIEEGSRGSSVPIIASVNCYNTNGSWVEYAQKIEGAGAAALELNVFIMPSTSSASGFEVENRYLELVQRVSEAISIPLSVKLPRGFTSPVNMAQQLSFRGVKGITMFNRFYSVDIDIDKMELTSGGVFSEPSDLHDLLRWIGMTSSQVPLVDIAASGGIHDSSGAIKALLCGATTVMLCTTLYKNGIGSLSDIISGVSSWAEVRGFSSVGDFMGTLSFKKEVNSEIYERAQFMRYFSGASH